MNLFKRASKLYQQMKASPQAKAKVENWWKRLGGNVSKLNQAITQGVKVYNRHHKSKQLSGIEYLENKYGWDAAVTGIYVDGIGILPIAGAAAALAAAAPIVKSLKKLFSSLGVKDSEAPDPSADINEDAGGGGGASAPDVEAPTPINDNYGGELPNNTGEDLEPDDAPTDDFGINDEAEYEEYTGEDMGAFWQSKAKRQASKRKRLAKQAAKKHPVNTAAANTPATPAPDTAAARKVKNRTYNITFGKQPGGPKIPTIKPMKPGQPRTTDDSGGIKQFFSDMSDWAKDHKFEVGLTAVGLASTFILPRILKNKKRRR